MTRLSAYLQAFYGHERPLSAYRERRRAHRGARAQRKIGSASMADWLIAECIVFGITTQNWMWVVAAAFLLYGLVLALMRRRPAA
jgi:hypothetical protein